MSRSLHTPSLPSLSFLTERKGTMGCLAFPVPCHGLHQHQTCVGWEGTGVNKALLGPRVARGPSNAVATLEQVWPFMTTRSHFYSCRGFSVLILMLSSHTPPHACPRIVGIKALCIQEYCNSLTVHICVHTCTLYPAGLHLQNTS